MRPIFARKFTRLLSCLRPFGEVALGLACLSPFLRAQGQGEAVLLRDATFEELAGLTITTVSRRVEKVIQVPAATTVLTRQDILESGATVLPEVLREVPGLNVAQISANTWAIGARGFQWQYANKLLVMVDGRSVYSPTIGGVRWEDNPVFMEDLDRVEVVRGPGSSIWGANAVNGVINVTTRSAFDTLGGFAFAGWTGPESGRVGARYGARLSETAAVRIFAQYQQSERDLLASGGPAEDGYHLGQVGARLDWKPAPSDTVTVQGDFHDGRTDYQRTIASLAHPPDYQVTTAEPIQSRGGNALARWRRDAGGGAASFEWQAYAEHSRRDWPQFDESVSTYDLDGAVYLPPTGPHTLTAGIGLRETRSKLERKLYGFDPAQYSARLFNGFIHDEVRLVPDHWTLTAGTKLEHQANTGWNLQPSVRLTWLAGPEMTVWGSWSEAVRTPTIAENTAAIDAAVYPPGIADPALPAVVRILGNTNLKPERLSARELGVRWQARPGLWADLSAFSYTYRNYVQVVPTAGFLEAGPPAALVLGEQYTNGIRGESYGAELALSWEPTPWWELTASDSFVRINLHTHLPDPLGYEQDETTTPRNSLVVSSNWHAGKRWRIHADLRQVGRVPYYSIPAYTEMDAHVAYQLDARWEISLGGRNLLHASHPEYESALNRQLTDIRRLISVSAKCNF